VGRKSTSTVFTENLSGNGTTLSSSVGTESSHSTKVAKSISEWWVESALEVGKSTGRTALIPEWAVERLRTTRAGRVFKL